MGKISDRIMGSVDEFAGRFGNRLATWGMSLVARGATKTLEDMEPGTISTMKETLQGIIDNPATPPEMRRLLESTIEEGNFMDTLAGFFLTIISVFPALLGAGAPLGTLFSHAIDLQVHSARLDPMSVITAWRRDQPSYEKYFQDLREQGWSDDRIEALKFTTLFYPAPADLVNWQAKEVFEPRMREKYGLSAELEELEREPFYKAGMTDEQIKNYWMAHWEHPELRTVIEMLRRTDFTEEDMREWFRLVEIPPFWRQKLIDISYEVPTRVDVRRWWDMRTISKERLREIYEHQGYHGEDLDDYVRWTMVYTDFPMMITRWKNGWITEQDVRDWLAGLEIPAERIDHFIQEKLKAEQPERTTKERDITKTDIIKGVKQGVITRTQGVELLVDMGYSEDESVYILEINIPPDEEEVIVRQRELTKTDIIKGLQAEVITEAEALERLQQLRYSRADATFLLAIYKALISPPAEPREREASKADIILAVKKGLIEPEDAYLMLQDIGFTPEASEFILMVKAETSPFSPISYSEFKDRTHRYRLAAGMEAKEMPEELKAAADLVVKLTGEVEDLTRSVEAEERLLVEGVIVPEAATERLRELQVTRNRAIAELERVTAHYNQLLAEWKHQAE